MKLYFLKAIIFFTTILYIFYIIYHSSFKNIVNNKLIIFSSSVATNMKNKHKQMKYILQWTSDTNVPFNSMGKGQSGFIKRQCPYQNCYVTSSRDYLGNYTNFDVIVFSGPEVLSSDRVKLPERRSLHQKFVFASIESPDNYQACTTTYNGYFNWTWTYKLDSEIRWGYIVIRDKDKRIIGPKKDMNWLKLEDMNPVTEDFKRKLSKKKKAAAWFVSNCYTKSRREVFVTSLEMELLQKYNIILDIYGSCRSLTCSRDHEEKCNKKIADNYYFYLAFENAFSEDYVTEKLVRALNNNAVPIVFGGANYTRFMPDGIYLNARELGVSKLAEKMNELIKDPEKYAEYFKWKNHYSYHLTTDSVETNEYCKMCEMVNDDDAMNEATVYDNFQEWWDGHFCSGR